MSLYELFNHCIHLYPVTVRIAKITITHSCKCLGIASSQVVYCSGSYSAYCAKILLVISILNFADNKCCSGNKNCNACYDEQ